MHPCTDGYPAILTAAWKKVIAFKAALAELRKPVETATAPIVSPVVDRQIVSKDRVARHGEVMTAPREVNAMLDLVSDEADRLDSRFLEPACGDGNFLVVILARKLRAVDAETIGGCESQMLVALSSIYAIDIQADNVERSRERLLTAIDADYRCRINRWTRKNFMLEARKVVDANIKWGDALTMTSPPGGDPIRWTEWEWTMPVVEESPIASDPDRASKHDDHARSIIMRAMRDTNHPGAPLPIREIVSAKVVKGEYGDGATAIVVMFDGLKAQFECSRWAPFPDAWSVGWKRMDGGSCAFKNGEWRRVEVHPDRIEAGA